jgi:hypothetical protein
MYDYYTSSVKFCKLIHVPVSTLIHCPWETGEGPHVHVHCTRKRMTRSVYVLPLKPVEGPFLCSTSIVCPIIACMIS